MPDVSPPDGSGSGYYKPQYVVSSQFRHFWEKMFHGVDLSDKEVSQMTDQFVKNVCGEMNKVLQWALQQQKERHQDEKENG